MIIKNFTIFENLRNQFSILEGYIGATSEFIERLNLLSKESNKTGKIASTIKNMIEDQMYVSDSKIKQNFFDLTDKDDTVSFITQSKFVKKLEDESPFSIKGRGEIKIGRAIKSLCDLWDLEYSKQPKRIIGSTSKDIEEFVNSFKSCKSNKEIEFRLVSGKDIAKYYNCEKYYNDKGSLGGSCMKDEDEGFFELYSKNPKKVQLLIYVDENDEIHGRSLVWKLSKSPTDAEYFMDRVYTNADSDQLKFKKFAEDQGWMYKKINNSWAENAVRFVYENKDVFGEIEVKIKGDCDEYPFLDTLIFLNEEKNLLSNTPIAPGFFKLEDTCGSYSDECSDCLNKIFVDEECDCGGLGEIDCDECYRGKVECVECGGSGEIECDECDGFGHCQKCGGSGKYKIRKNSKAESECPVCNGSGKCNKCHGDHEVACELCDGNGDLECVTCDGYGMIPCNCGEHGEKLCEECASGHILLANLGIETKWNKSILKKKK